MAITGTAVDCERLSVREINLTIRRLLREGERDIQLLHPNARHNLAVAILEPARLTFEGSVGYYCAGMVDGPEVHIRGNAGWGVAENMMSGTIVVEGNAGNSAGASLRGGTLVVRGNVGARTGISLKGGLVLVGGSSGYMTGFMAQRGTIIVCGDVGPALGDSLYEARIFVGGTIAELGNDADVKPLTEEDRTFLRDTLQRYQVDAPPEFKKIESGRRLWNFSKKEIGVWIQAL